VTSTKTRVNKIGTVIIPVSDQDRAIEFYVEKLGFEKRTDVPFGNGDRWVEVAPGDAVTTIALARRPRARRRATARRASPCRPMTSIPTTLS
jgi:catechol 2,3-dioxygenase-like lactoylglutathione lyase family enzyme